jgi:hypothetical protein
LVECVSVRVSWFGQTRPYQADGLPLGDSEWVRNCTSVTWLTR